MLAFGGVSKLVEQLAIAYRGLTRHCESFVVDLGEYCLLDWLSRGVLDNGSSHSLYLDSCGAPCFLFSGAITQAALEVTLLLLLYDRTDFLDCVLVLIFLC